jgi:DNA segregation ATPase FtsK/SpoIIIE-like protein
MREANVVVGRTETGHDLVLDFAAAWHTAIQGQTRSGKSVLTYNILSKLAAMPSVTVVGCDPTGILLHPFEEAPMPHLRALGTGDMSAHKKVLAALLVEMDRRIELLRSQDLDKLEEFTPELPLLVVVLEEFPGIMGAATGDDAVTGAKAAERLAPFIQVAVGRLVRESAKVGIRVILLAQRMSSQAVDTDARSQFGCRISLRLDNADAVKMLHDSVTPDLLAQWPTFAPGVGVYELPGQRQKFRADRIDYPTYIKCVRQHQQADTGHLPERNGPQS